MPNPNTYLFFDDIHPTAAGHRIIGELSATSMVPEPAALTILIMTAMFLTAHRRR